MDLLSLLITFLICIVTLIVVYALYMSSTHRTFENLGIPGPKPALVLGNFGEQGKLGVFEFQRKIYQQYKNEKVYGVYEARKPLLMIADLDMIKDIAVKHFSSFVNRRDFYTDEPMNHALTLIKDDHWRNVRSTVSPAFSTGKLKRMYTAIANRTKVLIQDMKGRQERNEEVELREVISRFTLDVIAATGFGIEVDSLKEPKNKFAETVKNIMDSAGRYFMITALAPFMWPILTRCGMGMLPKEATAYFRNFVDIVMANRKENPLEVSRRSDFLQLLLDAEEEGGTDNDNMAAVDAEALTMTSGRKKLSYLDIQGIGLVFVLAGYDTVATTMTFTLYLLALNSDCCQKAQKEVDDKLKGEFPTYESIQSLHYLDMCINESIRMFPSGILIDRQCASDVEIGGVQIPKGTVVGFPVYAIHHDPDIWTEPDKFDPERFTPEKKATRHPYAHLPFGAGPRNCIGMRLALLEIKVAVAAILQVLTPVRCQRSEFPVKLLPFQTQAANGSWIKFEARKK